LGQPSCMKIEKLNQTLQTCLSPLSLSLGLKISDHAQKKQPPSVVVVGVSPQSLVAALFPRSAPPLSHTVAILWSILFIVPSHCAVCALLALLITQTELLWILTKLLLLLPLVPISFLVNARWLIPKLNPNQRKRLALSTSRLSWFYCIFISTFNLVYEFCRSFWMLIVVFSCSKFQKRKVKIGKKLPPPKNTTNTEVKSKGNWQIYILYSPKFA
jgi:hypothetical protein